MIIIRHVTDDMYEWRLKGSSQWRPIKLSSITPEKYHGLIQHARNGGFITFNYHTFNPTTLILNIGNIKSEVGLT